MEQYNVRLFDYIDGRQQFRYYSRPVVKGKPVARSSPSTYEQELIKECPWTNDGEEVTIIKEPKQRTLEQIKHSYSVSMNRTKQTIYEIARSNRWEYFTTLTFDPQRHNSKNYDYITGIMHNWLKYLRNNYAPDLIYLVVPELHKDGEKYHFHGLFADCGNIPFIDSGKRAGKEPIYNIEAYKFGWSTATKVKDTFRVSSYITKYITKDLCAVTKGKKRYWCSQNCNRPKVKDYMLYPDEVSQIFSDCYENIMFIKDVQIPFLGQKITYVEMN